MNQERQIVTCTNCGEKFSNPLMLISEEMKKNNTRDANKMLSNMGQHTALFSKLYPISIQDSKPVYDFLGAQNSDSFSDTNIALSNLRSFSLYSKEQGFIISA